MFCLVSAHIPWNAIPNLELRWSYNVLRDDLVLPSATSVSNICRRDYALPADAMMKQLPSRNTGSFALDWWTSTNKLVVMLVIAYWIDQNWALGEIQLAFDKIDCQFFSTLARWLRFTWQGPTCWNNVSHTLEECAWSFWAYQWPIG
jgi:hypothetical protein